MTLSDQSRRVTDHRGKLFLDSCVLRHARDLTRFSGCFAGQIGKIRLILQGIVRSSTNFCKSGQQNQPKPIPNWCKTAGFALKTAIITLKTGVKSATR